MFVKPGAVCLLDRPLLGVVELQHDRGLVRPTREEGLSIAIKNPYLPMQHRLNQGTNFLLESAHPSVVARRANRTHAERVGGSGPAVLAGPVADEVIGPSSEVQDSATRRWRSSTQPPWPDVLIRQVLISAKDAWHVGQPIRRIATAAAVSGWRPKPAG